jgi:PKD repeat protein
MFSNTSVATVAMSVVWSFGDSTSATGNSVNHVYNHSGIYNVCMQVSTNNNTCVRDTCILINVNIPTPPPTTCNLVPNFTTTRSTTTNTFEFRNTTTGLSANAIVVWTFGDGLSDTGNIVLHTFVQNGSYNVCMKVIDSACTRTICRYVSTSNYLQAYPNPAQSYVNVNINLSQSTPIYAYVYNSQGMLVGQLLQQGMQGNNLLTFNVAALPSGYYTIRIYTANGVFISRFQKL